MEFSIKEYESVIGLIKFRNVVSRERSRLKEYIINPRKINILERLYSFTKNPNRNTIENISYLINLPERYVIEWFTRKNRYTNRDNRKDNISLEVLVNIFIFN